MTTAFPIGLIRPWYRAGLTGHVDPACSELLRWEVEAVEGSGWLDPYRGAVCFDDLCAARLIELGVVEWDAECGTCDTSLSEDEERARPVSVKDAREWMRLHECDPDSVKQKRTPDLRLIEPQLRKAA